MKGKLDADSIFVGFIVGIIIGLYGGAYLSDQNTRDASSSHQRQVLDSYSEMQTHQYRAVDVR